MVPKNSCFGSVRSVLSVVKTTSDFLHHATRRTHGTPRPPPDGADLAQNHLHHAPRHETLQATHGRGSGLMLVPLGTDP